jgi:hypothetical protein
MILLAVGLGVLGVCALRRARRCCYAGGYGWYGPWASGGEGDDGGAWHRGYHGHGGHGGGPWRGRHRGRGRRGRWMLHAVLARVDATPAQERVIVGELDRFQDRVREARGNLDGARADLSAAVRGSVLDDAALGAVLGRFDGTTGEVRAAMIEALRNVHAVLDEKQRAELAELVEHGGRRPRGSHGAGGGAGWWRMGPYR